MTYDLYLDGWAGQSMIYDLYLDGWANHSYDLYFDTVAGLTTP